MSSGWRDWLLPPRDLNRLLLSLALVSERPSSQFALGYVVFNVSPDSSYAQRLEQHYRGLDSGTGELLLDDDNVRYCASQLRSDYQLIQDGRWGVLTAVWTLLLSVLAGVISGLIVAHS